MRPISGAFSLVPLRTTSTSSPFDHTRATVTPRLCTGDHLELSDEAGPGDFIYVPPYVPHQEINASPDEGCEAVVVRNGQEPIVVNLDFETPEPASAGRAEIPFHPPGHGA